MKVLHVITSLLPGGAETLVAGLMPCLRAEGVEAEVAVFNAVDTPLMRRLTDGGFIVHRFSPGGASVYSPSNFLKLHKLAASGEYDIIHTHNTACQLYGALCPAPSRTRKITTEHNTSNRRRRYAALSHADRMMYRAYDRVVCISDRALTSLQDFVGHGIAAKCEVIANGIPLEKYAGGIGRVHPDGDIRLVMVAGFRPQKDQDTAVRAMACLPDRFRLTLVGDGERLERVRRLAADLGVAHRVVFAGFRDDVPALLKESDIVVMASHYEGMSLANVEGMASGRPFVASDVAGLHELTAGAGLLFPEGDHGALARILVRLASDPALYASTADLCRRRAARFDISTTARRYAECYRRVLS